MKIIAAMQSAIECEQFQDFLSFRNIHVDRCRKTVVNFQKVRNVPMMFIYLHYGLSLNPDGDMRFIFNIDNGIPELYQFNLATGLAEGFHIEEFDAEPDAEFVEPSENFLTDL
jgi:hypothetical protein